MKPSFLQASTQHTKPKSYANLYTKYIIPWIFLLPAVICFIFFVWHPILSSFWLSVHDVRFDQSDRFVGFKNFKQLLIKDSFWTAWKNTFYFSAIALVFGYFVPVVLAIMVNEMKRFQAFFRLSLYIPAMVPLVVAALMWKWFYNPSPAGLFNAILGLVGIEPQGWIGDPLMAMPSIALISTWLGMGSTMLIYLAALQNISVELYEASEIDGAGPLRRMFYITLPQLTPVLFIVLILQVLGTLKVFTEPFLLTDGGPANSTLTVMLDMYYYAFKYTQFGMASAYGVIIFLVLLIVTVFYLRVMKKWGSDD